jgi:death-on-curing protein
MNADALDFLDFDDVLDVHTAQLGVFGGGSGLRDPALLGSAVAQPQAAFGGQYAHDGLFAMAAAYLFHVVSNHPFVDGNKRAGLLSALAFLDLNGVTLARPTAALYALTMGVAEGRVEKAAIAAELERLVTAVA